MSNRVEAAEAAGRDDVMSSGTLTANAFTGGESKVNIRGWVIFAGITMMVLGIVAISYDATATIASVILFGWLLMLAGVMQIVNAFQVRSWSGFFLYLVDGILRATVGRPRRLPGCRRADADARAQLLLHRRRLVQDDRFNGSAVSRLGLDRGVRLGVDCPGRDARHAVANLRHMVHRLRRRSRPRSVRLGAADVCRAAVKKLFPSIA